MTWTDLFYEPIMTNTLRKQQAADRFIHEPMYRATIHIHDAARLSLAVYCVQEGSYYFYCWSIYVWTACDSRSSRSI